MEAMQLYKLPIVECLYLRQIDETNPPISAEMLQKRIEACHVVKFQERNITHREQDFFSITSTLEVNLGEDQESVSYIATFMISRLVELPINMLTTELIGEKMYGGRLSSSTKVIITDTKSIESEPSTNKHQRANWSFSFTNQKLSLQPFHGVSKLKCDQLYSALPDETVASLSGVANSIFSSTAIQTQTESFSGSVRVGSVLLCGASGSGGKTLTQHIAHQFDAHLLSVSTASLYATNTNSNSSGVTREWASKQLRLVVFSALSLRRCVLLLSDLHLLVPAVAKRSSDVKLTEAEEGFVEALTTSITELESLQTHCSTGVGTASTSNSASSSGNSSSIGSNSSSNSSNSTSNSSSSVSNNRHSGGMQLLLVGYTHDTQQVHVAVREKFANNVHIPLPSAKERRRLMRTAWDEHQHNNSGNSLLHNITTDTTSNTTTSNTNSTTNSTNNTTTSVTIINTTTPTTTSTTNHIPYPSHILNTIADNSTGLSIIPLLTLCRRAVADILHTHLNNDNTTKTANIGNSSVTGGVSSIVSSGINSVNSGVNGGISEPFAHVVGLEKVKKVLQETVLWPRRYSHLYRAFSCGSGSSNGGSVSGGGGSSVSGGVGSSSTGNDDGSGGSVSGSTDGGGEGTVGLCAGILLFGPPGTGKTLLPRTLAQELGCTLINLRISDVVRGEVGTSEKRVVQLVNEAKRCAPSVLFIDEFQALFTSRTDNSTNSSSSSSSSSDNTLTTTLASCFDDLNLWNKHAGAESLVTVIASTNEPWAVDVGFLRPGRLDKCVFVGPLDVYGRLEFLRTRMYSSSTSVDNNSSAGAGNSSGAGGSNSASGGSDTTHTADDTLLTTVAAATEGYTGADLTLLLARVQDLCTARCNNNTTVNANSTSNTTNNTTTNNTTNTSNTTNNTTTHATNTSNTTNNTHSTLQHATHNDFTQALHTTPPSTTTDDILDYTEWLAQYPYLQ